MKKYNYSAPVAYTDDTDYKALYEKEVEKHARLAEDYKQLDHDYMELDHENAELREKLEKYETIIHTVEAFIGQKIIDK